MDESSIVAIVVGLVLALLFAALIYTQRHRLARIAVIAGLEGIEFSAQFQEIVRREVSRVTKGTLHRTVVLDKQLIEFWEREGLNRTEDAAARFSLISKYVGELERVFAEAPADERAQVGFLLREAYWDLLRQARSFYASSEHYQRFREHVMTGLTRLEEFSA